MIDIRVPDPNKKIQQAYQNAKQKGVLRLNNCSISKFPDEIHRFDTYSLPGDNWWQDIPLVQIDLSNNPIPNIDSRINQLEHLQVLHILHANINQIPPTVFQIKQLKSLNLSFNQITSFEIDIQLMTANLKEFVLKGNQLSQLPLAQVQ